MRSSKNGRLSLPEHIRPVFAEDGALYRFHTKRKSFQSTSPPHFLKFDNIKHDPDTKKVYRIGLIIGQKSVPIDPNSIVHLRCCRYMSDKRKIQLKMNMLLEKKRREGSSQASLHKELSILSKFLKEVYGCTEVEIQINLSSDSLVSFLRNLFSTGKKIELFFVFAPSIYIGFEFLLKKDLTFTNLMNDVIHQFCGRSKDRPQRIFPTLFWNASMGVEIPKLQANSEQCMMKIAPLPLGCGSHHLERPILQTVDGLANKTKQYKDGEGSIDLILSALDAIKESQSKSSDSLSDCGENARVSVQFSGSIQDWKLKVGENKAGLLVDIRSQPECHSELLTFKLKRLIESCNLEYFMGETVEVATRKDFLETLTDVDAVCVQTNLITLFLSLNMLCDHNGVIIGRERITYNEIRSYFPHLRVIILQNGNQGTGATKYVVSEQTQVRRNGVTCRVPLIKRNDAQMTFISLCSSGEQLGIVSDAEDKKYMFALTLYASMLCRIAKDYKDAGSQFPTDELEIFNIIQALSMDMEASGKQTFLEYSAHHPTLKVDIQHCLTHEQIRKRNCPCIETTNVQNHM